MAEILLKVALNTTTLTLTPIEVENLSSFIIRSENRSCQFISPKGQWSEGSIVRRVNSPKGQ
jgi:hypothetical protein